MKYRILIASEKGIYREIEINKDKIRKNFSPSGTADPQKVLECLIKEDSEKIKLESIFFGVQKEISLYYNSYETLINCFETFLKEALEYAKSYQVKNVLVDKLKCKGGLIDLVSGDYSTNIYDSIYEFSGSAQLLLIK